MPPSHGLTEVLQHLPALMSKAREGRPYFCLTDSVIPSALCASSHATALVLCRVCTSREVHESTLHPPIVCPPHCLSFRDVSETSKGVYSGRILTLTDHRSQHVHWFRASSHHHLTLLPPTFLPSPHFQVSPPILQSHVLPMVLRGFEDPDPRLQEETLRRSAAMVSKLDFEFVKEALVPRVHMLALRTSVAAVSELPLSEPPVL